MRVHDILQSKGSSQVHTISPDATVGELLEALAVHDVGALVVSRDGEHLLGIVSERDIVRKLRSVPEPTRASVESIMTVDVTRCGLDDAAGDLMVLMTQERVRHVPVVEAGRLVGILSVGDAVKHRIDQLEFERDQLTSYVQG